MQIIPEIQAVGLQLMEQKKILLKEHYIILLETLLIMEWYKLSARKTGNNESEAVKDVKVKSLEEHLKDLDIQNKGIYTV